jgi:hypothetical protein
MSRNSASVVTVQRHGNFFWQAKPDGDSKGIMIAVPK